MITVSVPDDETRESIGAPPASVRVVVWNLYGEPSEGTRDDINVVLVPHYQLDRKPFEQFAAMPNLRAVQLPSAGFEHVLKYIPEGVTLCNGRGIHSEETAELALGLMLASLRGIVESAQNMIGEHAWHMTLRPSLYRSRVLVIGYGSIGDEIVKRLQAFGAQVTVVAYRARTENGLKVHGIDEVPDLLPNADVVTLIIPLTPETAGLVDDAFLSRMHDGALLVNVARGKIVDTDALVAHTKTGRIRAALDVTDPEPLPPDHPLWRSPGVVITPHEGGNTTATFAKTVELMRRQLVALSEGSPLANVVR